MGVNKKSKFIKELGEVFKTNGVNNIVGMTYVDNGVDEHCLIEYKGGDINMINISCDSLSAIVKDIVKQGGLD